MLAEVVQPIYASGDCEIDLARRELRILGSPVPVGGRAFEIIEVLAQSAGELVTKSELMDRVWPGAIVMDNTLQVHTAAVRKALGPHRSLLKTESGRGYRLLGNWSVRRQEAASPPSGRQHIRLVGERPSSNLPSTVTRLIGRAAAVRRVQDLISAYRVVTLAGPGGIGKTSLAIKVGRRALGDFADGAWLVELASVSNHTLIPSAVAGVLGLKFGGEEISADTIARAIGDRSILLILDNCEHVIDAAADLADTLIRQCPGTTILATSRETLRIGGECVYRVPPLDVPASAADDPDHIRGHSAVELFIARGEAQDSDFSLRAQMLPDVAAICRHLDGIPLAIEFAAARAALLGVEEVAAGLRDRFGLLTGGRRTALPRHKTLRATLDWSYDLLPEQEQRLLRRLGIFAGGFTLESAEIVAGTDKTLVINGIANLVAKSLIVPPDSGRWDQLETIRAYALEQLVASGEMTQVRRLHAEAMVGLYRRADAELAAGVTEEWRKKYEPEIGNLRLALHWAFGDDGDPELGVTLAALTTNFWIALSLLGEYCDWAARALARLGSARGTSQEIMLQGGFGLALSFARGVTPAAHDALMTALALAEANADYALQLRPIFGLWLYNVRAADFHASLTMGLRLEAIATVTQDDVVAAASNALLGISRFCLGEYAHAAINFERVPTLYPLAQRNNDATRFGVDFRSVARSYQAAALWAMGYAERATQAGLEAVEEARAIDRPLSLCLVLGITATTVLTRVGNFAQAERCIDELIHHAQASSLPPFHAVGLCARGCLMAAFGNAAEAEQLLLTGIAQLHEASINFYYPLFAAERAAVLGTLGRIEDGIAEIDAAQRQAESSGALWCMELILCVKGELLSKFSPGVEAAAEQAFLDSLSRARSGKALAFELRAAMGLARLWRDRGQVEQARAILIEVYDRLTEGFSTIDVVAAREILKTLT